MVTKKKSAGRIAIVGAGPGDRALLTVRAVEMLESADVLVGAEAVLEQVRELAPTEVELVIDTDSAAAISAALAAVKDGRAVTVVLPGDPFATHGGSDEVSAYAKALTRSRIGWELVPGVGTSAATAAYAGLAPASSGVSTYADVSEETDWSALAGVSGTLLLNVPATDAGKVAAALMEHGRRADEQASVTVSGTTTAQRTVVAALDSVGDVVEDAGLTGDAVMVLGAALKGRNMLSWWESRPLFGWRVLVPRTRAQAGETSALLRTYGAEPLEVPTIAVEPPRTPAPMERSIKGLVTGRYAWVVFTSANAVKAVQEKLAEFGLDARAFAGVKVAAVGTVTGAALEAYGIRPDLLPSGDQSSEGLLEDFPEYDDVRHAGPGLPAARRHRD